MNTPGITSGLRRPLAGILITFGFFASVLGSRPQTSPPLPLVVYLEDGPWVVTPELRNETPYLPLTDLVRQLVLPYTDATAAGIFTIRGPGATVVLERETGAATVDGNPLELRSPVVNEDGRWLVPVEFLQRALGPATGLSFAATAARIIAGNVETTSLDMEAAAAEGFTRLTVRLGRSTNVRVQQDRGQNLVTLNIDQAPLTPRTEALAYRDGSIRSVRFDDRDGRSRIVVETTPEVASVRLVPGDENRTFFLEFVSTSPPPVTVTAAPLPAEAVPAVDALETAGTRRVRVLVIDPGHGGLDSGTNAHGLLEKDLTLLLAQRLRATLEERLSTSVILTRGQDLASSIEDRTAVANQSHADLLISLHVGFSSDPSESRGTVFVMKDPTPVGPQSPGVFFIPWYQAHQTSDPASLRLAESLRERLSLKIPEWPFTLSRAPLGVLAGATMPAVILELGNANNPEDLERLANSQFQNRVIDGIVESIQGLEAGEDGT